MSATAARSAAAASLPSVQPSGRARLDSIDLLRGVVMVIMALDHTRDYFTELRFDPTDLAQTNAALFFTRWITHFCAPTFVFLAGTGAFLSHAGGKSRPALARFLVTRALWLVVLEFAVVRFGWAFNLDHSTMLWVQVIWALGVSMIALAGLIYLPLPVVAAVGVAMIAGHNLFDGVTPAALGDWGALWTVLHVGADHTFPRQHAVCGVSADPVDRRHGRGLRVRHGAAPPSGRAPARAAPDRRRAGRGVRRSPRDQRLWRSPALGAAVLGRAHAALVPEHHQVSAVAAVPADDPGTGHRLARVVRTALRPRRRGF